MQSKLTIFLKFVSSLSPEEYDDWLKARGKAWHLWPDSEFGFEIFHEWSKVASSYKNRAECHDLFFNFRGK